MVFFYAEENISIIGLQLYNKASCIIVGSLAAFLLGYNIILKRSDNNYIHTHTKLKHTELFIIINLVVFVILSYETTLNNLTFGRIIWRYEAEGFLSSAYDHRIRDILTLIKETYISTSSLIMPSIIAYSLCRMKKRPIVYGFFLSIPYFIYLFFSGVRYTFIASTLGFYFASIKLKNINKRQIRIFVIFIVIIFSLTLLQYYGRIKGFDIEEITYLYESRSFKVSEGTIRSMALCIYYIENNSPLYGKEFSTIITYLIPRYFWRDKPVTAGLWLIREVDSNIKNPIYSVAGSFAETLYLDFGYHIGILAYIFVGFLFCKLNLWLIRNNKSDSSPYMILSGIIYGFTIFAARSMITPIPIMYTIIIFLIVFVLICTRKIKHFNQKRILYFKKRFLFEIKSNY